MSFLTAINKLTATLTFIQLYDDEVEDDSQAQSLVDFVTMGLTDNVDRKVYKLKLTGLAKLKPVSCDTYDDNINTFPEKSRHPWIKVVNGEIPSLNSLNFEKDTSKYQKGYLNSMINERIVEFSLDSKNLS